MNTQPEQVQKNILIKQLVTLGYEQVKVTDDAELVANFKVQLERLNNASLSDHEFKQILNNINKGNVFNRANKKSGQASHFWFNR
jgi:type I restriction enzyme R subunit